MHRFLPLILLMMIGTCTAQAQSDSVSFSISSKYLQEVFARSGSLQSKLDKKTEKALASLQKQEEKMRRKLAKKDSAKAAEVFGNARQQYDKLQQRMDKLSSNKYISSLDTLSTSLKFLQQNPQLLSNVKQSQQQLTAAMDKVKSLQDQFQKAEELKKFIKERKQYLKSQLQNLGLAKELKKLNKQAYYYAAQVNEYKELVKDHKKAEKKALELLSQTKLFKDFMRKNSQLASLFRLPGGDADANTQASLAGLQARAQVNELIGQQLAAGGPDARAQFSQNLQQAQSQLNELKNKLNQLGGAGGSGDVEMPEDFKPNSQRTKSFWKKIEVGINAQSNRATGLLPVSSDIGLSAGYKPNDKLIVGVGLAGRVGWGKDIKHIAVSYQGASVRSFIEWKLKESFYLAGAYEQNYQHEYKKLDALKDRSAWQQSGLLGISKGVSLKTKVFKKTSIKLLWDFLSYQQVPRSRPILFRINYNF